MFVGDLHDAGRPGGSVGSLEASHRLVVGLNLGAVTRSGIFSHFHAQQSRATTCMLWAHKIRLGGRRGKGTAERLSR